MKNLVHVIIFIAILVSFNTDAQDYLYDSRSEILDEYKAIPHPGYNISIFDTSDRVTVSITGFENITATYFFNEEQACDSIILRYDCLQCLDTHVSSIVSNSRGRSKWIKYSEHLYLAKKWMRKSITGKVTTFGVPAMVIDTTVENVAVITISERSFSQEEWKQRKH